MVPSPCLNDAPRVTDVIDLLPEIDRGSIMKAGLEWSLALRPCATLVVRLVSGLLYFLFGVGTRGLVALVALATVIPLVPGASSRGATDQCSVTITLRS
jgi:hypothetical protein